MISANNITLRVGKKALFEDVNIKFTEGNCYGLIGANGAGKSTFLKILSGQLEPTNGDIVITPGQRLSFLQQDHFKYDTYPVLVQTLLRKYRSWDTTMIVFSKLIRNSSSHSIAGRSRWLVGSSRRRISGFPKRACARRTFTFWLPVSSDIKV